MSKLCNTCGGSKPLSAFYKRKDSSDGYRNDCKECVKKRSALRVERIYSTEEGRDEYVRLIREKRDKGLLKRTTESREVVNARIAKYQSENKNKVKANSKTRSLGKDAGYVWHHWSYKEEYFLDVFKLKSKPHYTVHRDLLYLNDEMCYTTRCGTLLDTKDKHRNYILSLNVEIHSEN